jgi:hypothetical protein
MHPLCRLASTYETLADARERFADCVFETSLADPINGGRLIDEAHNHLEQAAILRVRAAQLRQAIEEHDVADLRG